MVKYEEIGVHIITENNKITINMDKMVPAIIIGESDVVPAG